MLDFNAKLGHWPYRPLAGREALLKTMDACGIERAVVSSLSAVHYYNPHDGNAELARLIENHRHRLIPFAVIKPGFPGWLADVMQCIDEYGMRGFVLHPGYHGYPLDASDLGALMVTAEELGLPMCVQAGMEDPRRQYNRPIVHPLPAADIGAFARAYPDTTVVALGFRFGEPEKTGEPFPANLLFDTSNYETTGALAHAVATFGADKILFGTHFPLFTPHANVDKLRLAEIDDAARTAIAHGNAERLLGEG